MNSDLAICLTGLSLAAIIEVFDLTRLDLRVQDHFYHPAHGWLVSREGRLPKLILYDGAKLAFGALGILLTLDAPFPTASGIEAPVPRQDALFIVSCILAIPVTAWSLKRKTGVFYPEEIERDGGRQPHPDTPAVDSPGEERERGEGFPAAHCSGAFALMSLFFAWHGPMRWLGLTCGLGPGWAVGNYQVLQRGTRQLSD